MPQRPHQSRCRGRGRRRGNGSEGLRRGCADRRHRKQLRSAIRNVLVLERAAARVRADRGSGLGFGDGRDELWNAKHRLRNERASIPVHNKDGYIFEALTFTLGDCRACHRVGRLERELGFSCRKPLRHGRAENADLLHRRLPWEDNQPPHTAKKPDE